MKFKEIYYLLLTAVVTICIFHVSCSKETGSNSLTDYENRFFELDFEENNLALSSLEKKFFTTFPHNDPTLGKVVYDRRQWINDSIVVSKNGEGIYSYVKKRDDDRGFDSFRLTTKAYFNLNENAGRILFVFKGSFPSDKGLWPAWWLNGSNQDEWTYDAAMKAVTDDKLDSYSGKGEFYDTRSAVNCTDWPSGGEIDIIENINGEDLIHNTIHTCPQMCDSEWNDDGVIINCANSKATDPNPGCSGRKYTLTRKEGTFACLWEKESIKFYQWNSDYKVRESGGPLSQNPNPELWGEPYLKNKVKLYNSADECIDDKSQEWQCKNCEGYDQCRFSNIKMIFNTTVCGVWAGNKFDDSENAFENCERYVLGEGRDMIDKSYLKIEYVAVRGL